MEYPMRHLYFLGISTAQKHCITSISQVLYTVVQMLIKNTQHKFCWEMVISYYNYKATKVAQNVYNFLYRHITGVHLWQEVWNIGVLKGVL